MASVLMVPGIGNSGPTHWQTLWEQREPQRFVRIEQADWERPEASAWCDGFEQAVRRAGGPVVVVAHSLGSLLAVMATPRSADRIAAAMLVSVPDPASAAFPREETRGFESVPRAALPFPSLVVMSSNDPFGSVEHARALAGAWGSEFACIGDAGHINAASGLGDWPQGQTLLARLTAGLR
ncbi:alpha/beta fold hydrolase [Schlegelella sp. S2-27]|uniref:Alpha/beta fold hydrolase n=1 Tax=Caldimonas mangrovi TaxID=2944811 RepID=A0ABT0YVI2_9BURK|nr:alpha/beta fold hydrolase [Caldimonas mangrovi]MCM5682766.1 alpha/beta fold hydrolase [Caldimonas mangrovi]